jgi:hypothetical protein
VRIQIAMKRSLCAFAGGHEPGGFSQHQHSLSARAMTQHSLLTTELAHYLRGSARQARLRCVSVPGRPTIFMRKARIAPTLVPIRRTRQALVRSWSAFGVGEGSVAAAGCSSLSHVCICCRVSIVTLKVPHSPRLSPHAEKAPLLVHTQLQQQPLIYRWLRLLVAITLRCTWRKEPGAHTRAVRCKIISKVKVGSGGRACTQRVNYTPGGQIRGHRLQNDQLNARTGTIQKTCGGAEG